MLLIRCPYCEEERPELEFRHAGEAHIARAENIAGISDEAFEAFFFIRSNPKGLVYERWRHVHGCGRFFNAVRDTVSDRFFLTYKAGEKKPDPARFQRKVEAAQEVTTVEAGAGVVEPARQEAAAKPAAAPRGSSASPGSSKSAGVGAKSARSAKPKATAAAPADKAKPARSAPRKSTRKGEA